MRIYLYYELPEKPDASTLPENMQLGRKVDGTFRVTTCRHSVMELARVIEGHAICLFLDHSGCVHVPIKTVPSAYLERVCRLTLDLQDRGYTFRSF